METELRKWISDRSDTETLGRMHPLRDDWRIGAGWREQKQQKRTKRKARKTEKDRIRKRNRIPPADENVSRTETDGKTKTGRSSIRCMGLPSARWNRIRKRCSDRNPNRSDPKRFSPLDQREKRNVKGKEISDRKSDVQPANENANRVGKRKKWLKIRTFRNQRSETMINAMKNRGVSWDTPLTFLMFRYFYYSISLRSQSFAIPLPLHTHSFVPL